MGGGKRPRVFFLTSIFTSSARKVLPHSARFAPFLCPFGHFFRKFSAFCRVLRRKIRAISADFVANRRFAYEFLRIFKVQRPSTRNFGAFPKCKGCPHGIFANCWSAKGFHTEFLRIFKMQKPSTRNFWELLECKSRLHGIFANFQSAKAVHTQFLRVFRMQRASTRNFCAFCRKSEICLRVFASQKLAPCEKQKTRVSAR